MITYLDVSGQEINVILDISGSVFLDKKVKEILSLFLTLSKKVNLIRIDTEIRKISQISSMEEYEEDSKGIIYGGGTILQPAIDYVSNKENNLYMNATYLISDGFCDKINLEKSHDVVLISVGKPFDIGSKNHIDSFSQIIIS